MRDDGAVRTASGSLPDGEKRRAVYGGDLPVFEAVPRMVERCALADAMIRETFAKGPPVKAQFEMDREAYLSGVETLQRRFRGDDDVKGAFLAALGQVGVDLDQTYWGWLHLRVAPNVAGEASRVASSWFHHPASGATLSA